MYHLVKSSRMYTGVPYSGPANNYESATAETLEEAVALQERLNENNPVGFHIYEAETGRQIHVPRSSTCVRGEESCSAMGPSEE